MTADQIKWKPSSKNIEEANITRFMQEAANEWNLKLDNYKELHKWSIEHPEQFWTSVWKFGGIQGEMGNLVLTNPDKIFEARFFPEGKINYAMNLLKEQNETEALVFWGEEKVRRRISKKELYNQVSIFAQALKAAGITSGDRIAAYMSNMPESIIGFLAAASIGAIWSSCSPDFGPQGIIDRFSQIEPKILISVDGYFYHGKEIPVLGKVAEAVIKLPSIERVIIVPYLNETPDITLVSKSELLEDFVSGFLPEKIDFVQVPFNHPLYILYSSGTTGIPKCIVHSTGGVLLKHLSELQLHSDIKPGDRLFYYSTCGWMMWNWLVSGLKLGATLLLYDGSCFMRDGNILFDFADAEKMTQFGVSAKFLDECQKRGLKPIKTHSLASIRSIFSTGSPLSPESFDYVYESIKQNVCLSSISGGTDIVGCFVLGNPALPVWRGEIQCFGLGLDIDVFDEDGHSLSGKKGELVCKNPFPTIPVKFWNDTDGKRFHAAYFERFPNVWCHGDFVEKTPHDGIIIYGRSDAVLNPGGVRIGTAEIYRQVQQIHEVLESLAIGQKWGHDERIVLFVRLRDGLTLNNELIQKIKKIIAKNTTLHHVPEKIIQVTAIPCTKSGKIVELAVHNVIHGLPVKNMNALANPEALEQYRNLKELQF